MVDWQLLAVDIVCRANEYLQVPPGVQDAGLGQTPVCTHDARDFSSL